MNDTFLFIISLGSLFISGYLMFSQRRKNISESDASSAKAAAELNAQTITMINTMRQDLAQQKHSTDVLQDKVYILENQLKLERESTYLYKQYINYLLGGLTQLKGQLQMLKQPPAFEPITLEAFEMVQNA